MADAPRTKSFPAIYRIIRPFLEDDVPLPAIVRTSGVPLRTLRRWTEHYRRRELAGLQRRSQADKDSLRSLPADKKELVEALALEKPRRSVAAICRTIVTLAENCPDKTPGYTTVARIVGAIDPALLSLAHEGARPTASSMTSSTVAKPPPRTRCGKPTIRRSTSCCG